MSDLMKIPVPGILKYIRRLRADARRNLFLKNFENGSDCVCALHCTRERIENAETQIGSKIASGDRFNSLHAVNYKRSKKKKKSEINETKNEKQTKKKKVKRARAQPRANLYEH